MEFHFNNYKLLLENEFEERTGILYYTIKYGKFQLPIKLYIKYANNETIENNILGLNDIIYPNRYQFLDSFSDEVAIHCSEFVTMQNKHWIYYSGMYLLIDNIHISDPWILLCNDECKITYDSNKNPVLIRKTGEYVKDDKEIVIYGCNGSFYV